MCEANFKLWTYFEFMTLQGVFSHVFAHHSSLIHAIFELSTYRLIISKSIIVTFFTIRTDEAPIWLMEGSPTPKKRSNDCVSESWTL